MDVTLISKDSYFLFRKCLGTIFILDLLYFAPWFQMMFGREYQFNSPVQNRITASLLFLLWFLSSLSLIIIENPFLTAILLTIVFRFYYIESRTTNLFRGGGAVGILPAVIVTYIALIETAIFIELNWINCQFILLIMIFQIGIFMLDSSFNKMSSGYFRNQGFQFTVYNPFWTFWANFKTLRLIPSSFWRLINIFLPITQCLIASLLLFPNFQQYGVLLLSMGFVILTFIVRLGSLTILLSSLFVLYFDGIAPSYQLINFNELMMRIEPEVMIMAFLYLFIILFGQILVWLNYYKNIFLPVPLQKAVNFINSHLPILVWRVFTPDVVNLHCLVFEVDKIGSRRLLNKKNFTTDFGYNFFHKLRFFNVAESCVLSSIFNSVKYDRNNFSSTVDKIKRYCHTISPHLSDSDSSIEFEVYHVVLNEGAPPTDKLVSKWFFDGSEVKNSFVSDDSHKNISTFLRPYAGLGSYK